MSHEKGHETVSGQFFRMNHIVVKMGHSARERLKNLAKSGRRDPAYLFQRYAFERFYWRIGKSDYAERFILKGASLFTLWMGPMYRVTQDTDLESRLTLDHERIVTVFREIAAVPAPSDDGVRYDMDSMTVEDIKKQEDYKGVRVKFNAHIEQARIPLQFDIGFGDSVYPEPVFAEFPSLLGCEPPVVLVYPQYTVVAEKFSAMVERGLENSRLKDYFDLWALSGNFGFDFQLLRTAVSRTFGRKGTDVPRDWPVGLTDAFAGDRDKNLQWRAFLCKTEPATMPDSLANAVAGIREFLRPVIFQQDNSPVTWIAGVGWSNASHPRSSVAAPSAGRGE